jgi:hypothetical protein
MTLWLLFLVVAVVLVSVMRNLGVVYAGLKVAPPQGLPPTSTLKAGQLLPEVTLRTLTGDRRVISNLVAGTKYSIDVVSPGCGPCVQYLAQIGIGERPPDPLDTDVRLRMVVSVGSQEATDQLLQGVSIPEAVQVLVDEDHQIGAMWGITTTPSTIVVDEERRVVRQSFSAESMHSDGHSAARPQQQQVAPS